MCQWGHTLRPLLPQLLAKQINDRLVWQGAEPHLVPDFEVLPVLGRPGGHSGDAWQNHRGWRLSGWRK